MKKVSYRIKIETYGNGDTKYYPQKKVGLRWKWLDRDGEAYSFEGFCCWSRQDALDRIDRNYDEYYVSANTLVSTEFEYITRP